MRQLLSRILPLALVGVLAAGGIAYAITQGGGPTNVLVACAKNSDGALRLVADASSCSKNEHAVELQGPIPDGQTDFTVDCAAGQKIQDAVWQADIRAPATIHVQGTCVEEVNIDRDKVWIDAATPGSGITAPAGTGSALYLGNARDVQLHGLTLSGGTGPVLSVNASTFTADGLHIVGPAQDGIVLGGGSQGEVSDSTIENVASTGIGMWNGGGTLQMHGGTIAHSGYGGVACDSGEILLEGVAVSGNGVGVSAGGECYVAVQGGTVEGNAQDGLVAFGGTLVVEFGTVLQNNGKSGARAQGGGTVNISEAIVRGNNENGVAGWMGGDVSLNDTTVVDNHGNGIDLVGGSTAVVGSNVVVRGNAGDGLHFEDTSVGNIGPDTEIVDNTGWGVFCAPAPATAMIHVGPGLAHVSGNALGDVGCPTMH